MTGVKEEFGEFAVYDKTSGGSNFNNNMKSGARLIIHDEYNPKTAASFEDLLKTISCNDSNTFNVKGSFVEQNNLSGIVLISNYTLEEVYARANTAKNTDKEHVKWEAIQRRFTQINVGTPSRSQIELLGWEKFNTFEKVAGDLISDWITDCLEQRLPPQRKFIEKWEQSLNDSQSLINRTRMKLKDTYISSQSSDSIFTPKTPLTACTPTPCTPKGKMIGESALKIRSSVRIAKRESPNSKHLKKLKAGSPVASGTMP